MLKIFGQRREELHDLARARVGQRELLRVQELPVQRKTLLFVAVYGVSHDGMPEILGVDADLMRPARLQDEVGEGMRGKALDDVKVRDGVPAARSDNRHLQPVLGVPPDEGMHPAALFLEDALEQGKIFAVGRFFLDLPREREVRRIVLGNDQKPRRVLVDAMHDAGAQRAVDAA